MSQEELVYLIGQLIPANQASIAIYDAAVVLGATLTDMERTFNQQIFQLDHRYLQLLVNSRWPFLD